MTDLVGVLSDYGQIQPRRAHGGIYALAGFNYQLRAYVARLVESLGRDDRAVETAGQVFLEALSDLAERTNDDRLICIQAKRTLTTATLKDAADELLAIDLFLQQTHPDWHPKAQFELIASQGSPIDWTSLPANHPAYARVQQLLADGRLHPPRIEPDPGWRAIVAVWNTLDDPYGFVRFTLDRALGRTTSAADAQRVRDDICERYAALRRPAAHPGVLLTAQDFEPNPDLSPTLEIGREITLARLRDQQYMPRPHRREALLANLLTRADLRHRDLQCAARVFWLAGRSGVGKSVLLLQLVERLVLDGRRVLWLGGHTEQLEPALRTLAEVPAELCPEFIAIDDLYDRDARTRLDLESLGTFIDECGYRVWPLILTCGPTEFAEAFEEDARYRGFAVHREIVSPIAGCESQEIGEWYQHRTGRTPKLGPAFEQTHEDDGGLFISLAVELTHGDIRQFARRFADRVRVNDLDEALRLPLALNRLYLRAPYDWLSESDREKLTSLNLDGDFRLLDSGEKGKIVRLTHPHLADALYLALRKPGNIEAYTNDLLAIFRRSLEERNTRLVVQLLRLFSEPDNGLVGKRLTIANDAHLSRNCAEEWNKHTSLTLSNDNTAVISTCWASWAQRHPEIEETLGGNLANAALAKLDNALEVWPDCWMRLANYTSQRPALLEWARTRLPNPTRLKHQMWSFIWEECLTSSGGSDPWRTIGLHWLERSMRRPDWHYVWKKLLPEKEDENWENDPVLALGLRRLHTEHDGADWAYVLEDLLRLAQQRDEVSAELSSLGNDWLSGREERAEWPYVLRSLLDSAKNQSPSKAFINLLRIGHNWLSKHENRREWAYVWQHLLSIAQELPPTLLLNDLISLGKAWLIGREERSEWTHIWQTLLECTSAIAQTIPLSDLLSIGHMWLAGREDAPQWFYVWRALVKNHLNPPQSQALTHLLSLGHQWLSDHQERAEWFYVWKTLLENPRSLPLSITRIDLIALGGRWLDGREERAEWTHVWQALLSANLDLVLPTSQPLENLLFRGRHWLTGHEDRAEWTHVWQTLRANSSALPDSLTFAELRVVGRNWLSGREERSDWTFIWQDLLTEAATLPSPQALEDLIAIGHRWLTGNEDRSDWAHVWQGLIAKYRSRPSSQTFVDLLTIGHSWLSGREPRADWAHVWQDLIANATLLPSQQSLHDLFRLGCKWLIGREERPEWTHIWRDLLAHEINFPSTLTSMALLQQGHQWLEGRSSRADWCLVCETLLDHSYVETSFLDTAALHLARTGVNEPGWLIRAAKFIANSPQHRASLELSDELDRRLIACPNNGHWRIVDQVLSKIKDEKSGFPRKIQRLAHSVSNRTTAPAWRFAREAMIANRPVQGVITAIRDQFFSVELEIGLMARWPNNNHRPRLEKGSKMEFFVLIINPSKDYVEVGIKKPTDIKVGEIHEGKVIDQRDYGLIVEIYPRTGLLHSSRCSNFSEFRTMHPKGSRIKVKVLGQKDRGLELAPSKDQALPMASEAHLKIGEKCEAIITGVKDYGLFVRIGNNKGLVHKQKFLIDKYRQSDYSLGMTILVQILEVKADGKLVLAPTIKRKHLS